MEPAWTNNTVSWLAIRAARCPTKTATAELASPRALRSTGNFGRVVDRPGVQFREVSVTIGRNQALAKLVNGKTRYRVSAAGYFMTLVREFASQL